MTTARRAAKVTHERITVVSANADVWVLTSVVAVVVTVTERTSRGLDETREGSSVHGVNLDDGVVEQDDDGGGNGATEHDNGGEDEKSLGNETRVPGSVTHLALTVELELGVDGDNERETGSRGRQSDSGGNILSLELCGDTSGFGEVFLSCQ